MTRTRPMWPLPGSSPKGAIPTRAQLDDNLAATSLALSDNQIRRLDEASTAYWDRIAGGKRALLGPPTVPAL